MQVSPSGMASASQADSGEFDSRHLLHKSTSFDKGLVDFTYLYKIFILRKKLAVVYWQTKNICYNTLTFASEINKKWGIMGLLLRTYRNSD